MFYITVPPDGQLGGFELMVTPDSKMSLMQNVREWDYWVMGPVHTLFHKTLSNCSPDCL